MRDFAVATVPTSKVIETSTNTNERTEMETNELITVIAIMATSLILLAYMIKVEADRREAERAIRWRRAYESMKRMEAEEGKIDWK